MSPTTIIQVDNLRKTYGRIVAVDGVSFHVNEGEIFGLLGPNGAGKTTTVECLQGLRRVKSGMVRVLGLDPSTEAQTIRRQIGSQLQESALPDRIKVWEALNLFSAIGSGTNWQDLLDTWGLSEKRNAAFGTLSGGQRQRLFVALSLINNPRLVFLDEMTTGLDPAARRVTWGLIQKIRERGTTVILVTHFMDEAEHLCDRLAIMNRGKIVALDSPQGLIATHMRQQKVMFSADQNDLTWLSSVAGVSRVRRDGTHVEVEGNGPLLALVASELVKHGIAPADLRTEQPTLEEVFLKITGSSLHE